MSWADVCGNCGSHRADCDCGNWSIVKTIFNMHEILMDLFEEIKHGDAEHQEWLRKKIVDFANRHSNVTRVEVIGDEGREHINWHKDNKVELSYQDGDKTLKIFINRKHMAQQGELSDKDLKWAKAHKMKRDTWIRNVLKVFPEKSRQEVETLHDRIFESKPN